MERQDRTDLYLAVGEFVSNLGVFEGSCFMVAGLTDPSRTIQSWELDGASKCIATIRTRIGRFPVRDRLSMMYHLDEAQGLLDLRNALVHGRWTLADAESGTYLSERAAVPRDLLNLLGSKALPGREKDHPTRRREFNAAGVQAAAHRMRGVATFFLDGLDDWSVELDAPLD